MLNLSLKFLLHKAHTKSLETDSSYISTTMNEQVLILFYCCWQVFTCTNFLCSDTLWSALTSQLSQSFCSWFSNRANTEKHTLKVNRPQTPFDRRANVTQKHNHISLPWLIRIWHSLTDEGERFLVQWLCQKSLTNLSSLNCACDAVSCRNKLSVF